MKTAIVIVALLSSWSSLAVAQLQCEVEIIKKEILPYEPLEMVCSLRSTNADPVTVEYGRALRVRLARRNRRDTDWEWSSWDHPMSGPPRLRPWVAIKEFAPNEVYACGVVPVFTWVQAEDWRGIWGKPGKVPVQGIVGKLISQPVTISIVEPKGIAAEACQAWTNLPLYYFYEEREVADHKLVKRIVEFVERYEGTVYADHALVRLGRMHIRGIADELDVERPVYRPDLDRADKFLRAAMNSRRSDVNELAQYYMAQSRLAHDDKLGASQILEKLLRDGKDPAVRFRADKLRKDKLSGER